MGTATFMSISCALSSILPPFHKHNQSSKATAVRANSPNKHSSRLLDSLSSSSSLSNTNHIIRKFVSSSSKATSLKTLSLLLDHSSPFSHLMYERIRSTHWFSWNPKLASQVISVLEYNGSSDKANDLILESISMFTSENEIALFYCDLIDAAAERKLKRMVFECYANTETVPAIQKRKFETMIKALSLMGMVTDAENLLDEMHHSQYAPSKFEYRMVIQGYGLLGLLDDMIRVVEKMENVGLSLDTVCANIVLSCYGSHGKLKEMRHWIKNMRDLEVGLSTRTFNSVLNHCPCLSKMVQDSDTLPLCYDDLIERLSNEDEVLLVKEMTNSSFLAENVKWSDTEWKLDLHGFHLASAYVILLQWMELLKSRIKVKEDANIPLQVSVVCGSGKHSIVRGESPIKKLVSKLMVRTKSPLKIDRNNVGKLVAKSKAVRDWIS